MLKLQNVTPINAGISSIAPIKPPYPGFEVVDQALDLLPEEPLPGYANA